MIGTGISIVVVVDPTRDRIAAIGPSFINNPHAGQSSTVRTALELLALLILFATGWVSLFVATPDLTPLLVVVAPRSNPT